MFFKSTLFAVVALLMGCQSDEVQTLTRSRTGGLTQEQVEQVPPPSFSLQLQASALSVPNGGTVTLTVINGQAPFTFRMSRGSGSVTSNGVFTAGMVPGRAVVEAQDARGDRGLANISVTPNDTLFGQLFGLHNPTSDADIDALEAWDIDADCRAIQNGVPLIRIGVIDTGIDTTHPDLTANLAMNAGEVAGNGLDDDGNGFPDDVMGWNFIPTPQDPIGTNDATDDNFHGTHVAGTIGAVGGNNRGVTGVCPRAAIMPLKFLDAFGGGSLFDAISAFDYARLNNIKVLNNSWGGGGFSNTMFQSIQSLNASGVLFLAAAGNGGADGVGDNNNATPSFPADYDVPNVVSIAATDRNDVLGSFSNFGATAVDIAAPGVNILSTFPVVATEAMLDPAGDGTVAPFSTSFETISGTSMATPHVTGAAALVWAHTPTLTMVQVKDALLNNADTKTNLNNRVAGMRRLNVRRALDPAFPRP